MKNNLGVSDLLIKLALNNKPTDNLTYKELFQSLGHRAFGIAFIFLALPSALPSSIIPGMSFVFGVPIILFAIQMMFARKTLWLPNVIANRKVPHEKMSKLIRLALPYFKKIEKFLKPRWYIMTKPVIEIFNGIIIFIMAVLLILPIPFSNAVLASLIIIFSLGFTEKDGLFIVLGYIGFLTYTAFIFIFIATIRATF